MEKTVYGAASAVTPGIDSQDVESSAATPPSDTFFSQQWHLYNTGQTGGLAGIDLNVLEVWDEYKGAGVNVAVIDDGFDLDHPDLAVNFNLSTDWDARDGDNNPTYSSGDNHGTAVAGVIAADDNGTGVVGVAPDAGVSGIRIGYGVDFQIFDLNDAMGRMKEYDVVNNSWGFVGSFSDDRANSYFNTTFASIDDAVTDGRGGLGTVVLFAAGNSRADGDNSNYHNLLNDTRTIAVGAIEDDGTFSGFSSKGANILVSAPGSAVVTTDIEGSDGYVAGDVVNISGTSFSTPAIAGIVALMLEANDQLGYRDIQEILAASARQIDAGHSDWQFNGSTQWNGGGMHFSHQYGFGLVDAHSAVRLAESWSLQSTKVNLDQNLSSNATLNISGGTDTSSSLTIINDMRIEQVEVHLTLTGSVVSSGQSIVLIAPDGTESVLIDEIGLTAAGNPGGRSLPSNLDFTFSTVAHWGQQAVGTWRLEYRDSHVNDTGSFEWSMRFHGETFHGNDVHVFTDEFAGLAGQAGRSTLSDNDGGYDVLNLSAVTSDSMIDLTGGSSGMIAGQAVQNGAGGNFEAVIGGDGHDIFTGNAADNQIYGGRGNDTVYASAGNDQLAGNDGNDTYVTTKNYTDYAASVDQQGLITLQASDGIDTLTEFENFDFNGQQMTYNQLVQLINTPVNPSDLIADIRWIGGSQQFTVNVTPQQQLSYNDLGINASTDTALTYGIDGNNTTVITGEVGALDSVAIDHSLSHDLEINNFRFTDITLGNGGNSLLNINNIDVASVEVGDGDDGISITFNPTGAAQASSTIDSGAGHDVVMLTTDASATGARLNVTTGEGNDTVTHDGAGLLIVDTGAGNDNVTAAQARDRITTGDGNDTVLAGAGNDTVNAGADNDMVEGGAGNDQLFGEDGNDTIYGQDGRDLINGGAGVDGLHGGAETDFIFGEGGADEIHGDGGDDQLFGGDAADTIFGGVGNDQIQGDEGNDIIEGGDDHDTVFGGTGDDNIKGQAGRDVLYGGAGNDIITGGADNDILYGNEGNDDLDGGAGDDRVLARGGSNTLKGGEGSDTIFGAEGVDTIYGGDDDDLITGGQDHDEIHGDDGNDTIYGAQGNDVIYAGIGTDRVNADDGNDVIYGGDDSDILSGDNGNDEIHGDAGNDWLYGGDGSDKIYGGADNDYLYGRNEIDILMGGLGIDSLDGGDGADRLTGGAGIDFLTGGNDSDRFIASVDEDSTDRILDWGVNGAADAIDLSQLLSFNSSTDDVNDFVNFASRGGAIGTLVEVNRDGVGNDWETVFEVDNADMSSIALNALIASGQLIVE